MTYIRRFLEKEKKPWIGYSSYTRDGQFKHPAWPAVSCLVCTSSIRPAGWFSWAVNSSFSGNLPRTGQVCIFTVQRNLAPHTR